MEAIEIESFRTISRSEGARDQVRHSPKSNRTKAIRYSKKLYRQRNCIERRAVGHLKINRAVATRYDQLAESLVMLFIASARYWIKCVHAA